MNQTKQYISNELTQIEDDFHKTFYMLLGNAVVIREMLPKMMLAIQKVRHKDKIAVQTFIKIKNAIDNLCLLSENVEAHYRVENKEAKEAYKLMHADICKIIGITAATIPFERYDAFAELLIAFNQGDYTQIEEHLLDSLIDYEDGTTLEGFGLIQRYCPDLNVDIKEQMAKDLVKWSDLRNLKMK